MMVYIGRIYPHLKDTKFLSLTMLNSDMTSLENRVDPDQLAS